MADRLLIGTRKGLFEARRSASGWAFAEPKMKGLPISYAMRDARDGRVWASIDHGHWGSKLSVSADDGATFQEASPPKYPGSTKQAARYYWILQPGHASESGTIWVGTEPGGLFVTRDGGETWSLNESLWALREEHRWMGGGRDEAGVHSICLDPDDPKHLYVGVSCAGVLETRDGGESWVYRNQGIQATMQPEEGTEYGHDPHFVALCPSAPHVLWQQNHIGVYKSEDGGASWRELTQKPYVDFGFPVAVHPQNPDLAWIAPMDSDERRMSIGGALVVMRTEDGGQTWQEGREGLPQENAWDFALRHALDISADGAALAMGTTSGSVYVSDDGGATWNALATHLPTVYSVRFA